LGRQQTVDLDEVWRKRVKYDALNLKMADKTWEEKKLKNVTKRYKEPLKDSVKTNSESVFRQSDSICTQNH